MSEISTLIDELEDTIASGTAERRLNALKRVTDLFLSGCRTYSEEQVALFDDVLLRLTAEVEIKARARLAERLAPIGNAPRKLIRVLAFDDAIQVAAPVLISSTLLTERDLVENATSKSQNHLFAIAHRPTLGKAVTDVLVERGDRRVLLSVARNPGAQFSETGFGKLVERTRGDDELARAVGRRPDIPRPHFIRLLETASAAVRAKLVAANPEAAAEIEEMVTEVASAISQDARNASREYKLASKAARRRQRTHQLSEAAVHAAARSQHFERTVATLATLGQYPVDLVERALLDEGTDMILILLKAAACTRVTAKSILLMNVAGRGMSDHDLDEALARFDRLNPETAKRVIMFHQQRRRVQARQEAQASEAAPTSVAAAIALPSQTPTAA
jgi:uncharacterized protein (DUF2336 family)